MRLVRHRSLCGRVVLENKTCRGWLLAAIWKMVTGAKDKKGSFGRERIPAAWALLEVRWNGDDMRRNAKREAGWQLSQAHYCVSDLPGTQLPLPHCPHIAGRWYIHSTLR
jgi:hypothetical protein